jgi:hypothetical protein
MVEDLWNLDESELSGSHYPVTATYSIISKHGKGVYAIREQGVWLLVIIWEESSPGRRYKRLSECKDLGG